MSGPGELGLPEHVTGCLFDLDGVLTSTAAVHQEAWARVFDEFLANRGGDTRRFGDQDYRSYVDGRPRYDGVREFLRSRDIELPEGTPGDATDVPSVHGLGNRKNELFLNLLDERGVHVYPGSRRYLNAVRRAGLRIGVVTSSANGATVLRTGGIAGFVDARVDGRTIARRGLRGKPEPDSFLACATQLGLAPDTAAVFEDAVAGVRAGRSGGFGWVIGVDREQEPQQLRDNGADVVVTDLADLLAADPAGQHR